MTDDISASRMVAWDHYRKVPPAEALALIYADALSAAKVATSWYWDKIRNKRRSSHAARMFVMLFLAFGTVMPLSSAAMPESGDRLLATQSGLVALAIAGLLQLADRAFGWSSGWMRYISTVTTMESVTSAFVLEWARASLAMPEPPTLEDVLERLAVVTTFEKEIKRLVNEETSGWIAEFNTGIGLLEAQIKSQREDVTRQVDELKKDHAANLEREAAVRKAEAAAARAREAASADKPGLVNLEISRGGNMGLLTIRIDEDVVTSGFAGSRWASPQIKPGLHRISIEDEASSGTKAMATQGFRMPPDGLETVVVKLVE